MKTCPKCGRANSPTRKFCMRCGASLLKSLEEETPEPEQAKPTSAAPQPDVSKTEKASISTDDRWARPSQVEKDRVRTTPVKKTEMEKAMEVFSKADQVTPQESQSGIVEERMLRASEVHELLEKMQSEEPVSQPEMSETLPSQTTPPIAPETAPSPPGAPSQAPRAEPPGSMDTGPPEQAIETIPKPPQPLEKPPEPVVKPSESIQPPAPRVSEQKMKPPTTAAAPASIGTTTSDKSVPEIEKIKREVSGYIDDEEIKDYITRLTPLFVELKVVKSELDSVMAHLEEQVQNARNAAEVKRIAYENLQEQIRLAKDEFESTQKEADRTEKRRDKEMSTRQKRIDDIEKRIERGEKAIEKRVGKIEKEREKEEKEKEKQLADKK
jgi:hypothetical protein